MKTIKTKDERIRIKILIQNIKQKDQDKNTKVKMKNIKYVRPKYKQIFITME